MHCGGAVMWTSVRSWWTRRISNEEIMEARVKSGPTQPNGASGGACRGSGAFTLIEVLVVVAIIALLVAILLPSLARARQQAKMLVCQTNVHQLSTAFIMYSVENGHRLPGSFYDYAADWLGRANKVNSANYPIGREPEDGTIYRYVGRNSRAYACPDDTRDSALDGYYRSYSAPLILSGAKPEMISYGHYRQSSSRTDPLNFSETDHTAFMRRLPGVPMIVEEDAEWGLRNNDEGGWCNTDCVSDRHLYSNGSGYGVLGFIDGSVGRAQLPPRRQTPDSPPTFHGNSMCLRVGHKWVSGLAFGGSRYGLMDRVGSAESMGVRH
jgi:prepilin-type N-terminal cleavage/methylation domain-containing protein